MNWSDLEYSVSDGQPVKLYEFIRGSGSTIATYCYTNADKNLSVEDVTYNAIPVSDDGLNGNADNSLTVTLPANNPIVKLFRGMPPSSSIRLRVLVLQETFTRLVWLGKISDCKRTTTESAELTAGNIMSNFTRIGARLTWRRSCTHTIFDHNCRMQKHNYEVRAIIETFDGASLTLSALNEQDGWFDGGFIEWFDSDGVIERRSIESQKANKIYLLGGTSGLTVGMSIQLYPGCSRIISVCKNKFSNYLNCGGVPGLPGKSPFDGTKIF